jgi:hypothetical protein
MRALHHAFSTACAFPLFESTLVGANILIAQFGERFRRHRLGGHFGPPQYTTISVFRGKFVLRTSWPTLSRGTGREPAMFSPLNQSSVKTLQSWNGGLQSICRTFWVAIFLTVASVGAAGLFAMLFG